MKPDNGPRVRAIDAPASWAGWPDDRVSCASCARRQGAYCTVTNRTHVPIGIRHRREDFRKRRAA